MAQPLVTVSIAAYNVEQFLEKGIQYILNQTYHNLDIIIVNDGSTDRTPEICENLKKKDSRIRVFHKENGGLGSARNVGIDEAKGEYLYFFDVDSLDAWMVIPISLFNIFEFLYFLFVSMLLSVATNRTYRDSMNFVTSTYCTGLILYIIIVVFIVLCIVE